MTAQHSLTHKKLDIISWRSLRVFWLTVQCSPHLPSLIAFRSFFIFYFYFLYVGYSSCPNLSNWRRCSFLCLSVDRRRWHSVEGRCDRDSVAVDSVNVTLQCTLRVPKWTVEFKWSDQTSFKVYFAASLFTVSRSWNETAIFNYCRIKSSCMQLNIRFYHWALVTWFLLLSACPPSGKSHSPSNGELSRHGLQEKVRGWIYDTQFCILT